MNPEQDDNGGKKFELHDAHIPADVIYMIIRGEIALSELLILLIVRASTTARKTKGNGKCWMTNTYLARSIKKNPNYICGVLKSLERKKLLKITYHDGRRRLRVSWDWEFRGNKKYQNSVQKNLNGIQKNLNSDSEKPERTIQKNLNHKYSKEVKNNSSRRSANGRQPAPDTALFGNSPQPVEFHRDCAAKLFSALVAARLISARSRCNKWYDEFRLLEEDYPRQEITATLDLYLKNLKTPYMPEALSAASFREKFARIRSALARKDYDARAKEDDYKGI